MAPSTPPIVVSSDLDTFQPLALTRSDSKWEDEVREVSQARMQLERDDNTGSRDLHFDRSKIQDLNDCVENEDDREKLARCLGSKIVFEARNRCHDSIRQGLDDEGAEALEDGLKLLNNRLGDGSDHWRLNQVELLLDLGLDQEARTLLNNNATAEGNDTNKIEHKHKWSTPRLKDITLGRLKPKDIASDKPELKDVAPDRPGKKRCLRSQYRALKPQTQAQAQSQPKPLLRTPSQNRRRSTINTDAEYEKMLYLDLCHKNLDLALRAEEWDQVRKSKLELHELDPSYFDINKPLTRFSKIRQLLNIGHLAELEAVAKEQENDLVKQRSCLEEALGAYQHGCHETDLFHKHFDNIPYAQVYEYDHIDCANLFFSAARVCIAFHERQFKDGRGRLVGPRVCKVEPSLLESTWTEQALHFLEQGRSRALLDSIYRGEEFVPPFQRKLLDSAVDSVAYAAQASIRIKKRDSLLPDSTPSSPPSQAVSPTDAPSDAFRLFRTESRPVPPNASPIFMQAVDQTRRRSTLDTGERPNLLDSEPTTPILAPQSPRGSFSIEQMKSLRAQMRWRRAKLWAFSEISPTFNAAAAALPDAKIRRFREMRKSIPQDTVIIEYGLPSSKPSGLVTLLISAQGVDAAVWRETSSKEITTLVKTIRRKMSEDYAVTRRDAPSPVSPKSVRSLPDFDDKTVEDLRSSLYEHLIGPIEVALRAKVPQQVIVIPSGELAHVPWGMLLDVPFSIIPSLSIWHRLHQQSPASVSRHPKVSVFSNKPKDDDGTSRDIPFSRVEALYLSWLHSQRPALADDYDRTMFEQLSRSTEILHLCAHSDFNDHDPSKSAVKLFKEPWPVTQWRELAIKAHIVVFSSCLSAASRAYDSGSTFGFAHTLLATGTRAFIGSLWPVEDEPTLLLMMLFYEELHRPLPPVEALYLAQCRLRELNQQHLWELLELLKKMFKELGSEAKTYVNSPRTWIRILERYDVARLRDPRCWAAFVLTGYGFKAIYPERT